MPEDSKSEVGSLNAVTTRSSVRRMVCTIVHFPLHLRSHNVQFPGITRRLPFGKVFMRRRKQQSDVDNNSDRRVVVSVDADAQELLVGGAESDVEQVASELEYVISRHPPLSVHVSRPTIGHRHYTRELFWRPAADG